MVGPESYAPSVHRERIRLTGLALGGTEPQWEESYKKAAAIVEKLSLPAKVNITTGTGWSMGFCVGNTGPALDPKTGKELFPSLCLQDSPLGIRFSDHATAWPAGLTVGATWNRKLFYLRGKLHAREARLKGVNAILGPCMGPIGRLPAGGRNWEGFGSDPVLQGIASAETIKGIQSEGVIATAKHYVGEIPRSCQIKLCWSNMLKRTSRSISGRPMNGALALLSVPISMTEHSTSSMSGPSPIASKQESAQLCARIK